MNYLEGTVRFLQVLVTILFIGIIALMGLLLYDYNYSEEVYSYISTEGVLSSTTFMIEDEKPYAVSFENELYDVIYVPEELTEKAKELLQTTNGEEKQYIKVTCILKRTSKNTVLLSRIFTYQIVEIESAE